MFGPCIIFLINGEQKRINVRGKATPLGKLRKSIASTNGKQTKIKLALGLSQDGSASNNKKWSASIMVVAVVML